MSRFVANEEQLERIQKIHDKFIKEYRDRENGLQMLDAMLANTNQGLTNRALDDAYKTLGIVDYDPQWKGEKPTYTHKRAEASRREGRR